MAGPYLSFKVTPPQGKATGSSAGCALTVKQNDL
jgi:hypothetical protein